MLTVTATNLADSSLDDYEQLDIFSAPEEPTVKNENKIDIAVDKIRQKFGSSSIVNASIIGTDIGIYENKNSKKSIFNQVSRLKILDFCSSFL